MLISYRRTGGLLALLTVAAVGLAAIIVTFAVAATLLILIVVTTTVTLAGRAVLGWWRPNHLRHPATPWPNETIDVELIPPAPSGTRHLTGIARDKAV